MVADAITGNMSPEATRPFGNIFADAMRGMAAMIVATGAAHADTFTLSFSSAADQSALGGAGITGFSGSATLTGTLVSPGQYNITGSSGTSIIDPNFGSQGYTYVANPSPPLCIGESGRVYQL